LIFGDLERADKSHGAIWTAARRLRETQVGHMDVNQSASQAGMVEEAPLSERSEFGRRAIPVEKRRGPGRLHRPGGRRSLRFWLLLTRQKEPADRRKLLILSFGFFDEAEARSNAFTR
jgi:hypothetical protein